MSDNLETKIVTIDLDSESYEIYIGDGLLFRTAELVPEEMMSRSVFMFT